MIAASAGEGLACPSCVTAKTGNGYLLATAVLLALPFASLAGFALWLRRESMMRRRPIPGPDPGSDSPGHEA
ncbi:MAG TPA: hypothetical protein VFP58_01950 [Candidatus Eisenbacteria bacterium]|nr:hypothetical protein [Candidatus Eisenbacteria bacterium]